MITVETRAEVPGVWMSFSRRFWAALAALVAILLVLGTGVANAIPGGGGDGDPPADDCVASSTGQVTVTPSTVTVGQSVTVSWNVDQIPGCTVWKHMNGLGFGGGSVDNTGGRVVVLNTQGTTGWELTVTGPLGNVYTLDTTTVTVQPQTGPPAVSSRAALSVITAQEADLVDNKPGKWADVPGLSTAVSAQAGSTLAATVSAEVYTSKTVWFRVLVDGAVSAPGDVAYKFDGADFDGTRSFTFGRENLAAGRHVVQVQWFTNPGTWAQVGKRTLTVNTDGSDTGAGRLYHVAAESAWLTKTTQTWESVPDLARTVSLDGARDLKITFSGQTTGGSGGFFARAVVDGQPGEDVLFGGAGVPGGARSYVFVRKGVGAGTHTVSIQWFANGGSALLADRAMTVFATPASAADGGLTTSVYQGGPDTIPDGPFTTLGNIGGSITTYSGGTNVEVAVGVEVRSTGRARLRVLFDGTPLNPSDVVVSDSVSQLRAQSYSFAAKNVLPGTHNIQVQIQAATGTAYVADRTLAVTFTRRPGTDFAQPYRSLRPRVGLSPPVYAICFDPGRALHPAPSFSYLRGIYEGTDGGRSVKAWFQENTGGQFGLAAPTYIGCADGNWLAPPPGRTGNWYWDTGNYTLMLQDALTAADPYIDFPALDLNGDHVITSDEAVIEVIRPQNDPFGTNRGAEVTLDGVSMGVALLDLYLSSFNSDEWRLKNVGSLAHETSHHVLGAADMYWKTATEPTWYSIMDSGAEKATHLDAFHKLKSGFVTPGVVEINKWTTATVTLTAVETGHEVTIIYDPARADKEYFILENRWDGGNTTPNYDAPLRSLSTGVVVWHVVEDTALQDQYPPPGGGAIDSGDWGRKAVRKIAVLGFPGRAQLLTWADGSSTGIQVTSVTNPQVTVEVEIAKV
ncbi:hypothetical protein J5X84_26525 [Streptosporangiaceae bacterium NEAU-GS5]|nr:hypothetical protein [Streptosporangiaceae bacterium NEAU-GS5]